MMEPLTWTGALSFLNPILTIAIVVLLISIVVAILASLLAADKHPIVQTDGSLASGPKGLDDWAGLAVRFSFFAVVAIVLAYMVGGIALPDLEQKGIIGALATQLLPVWIALLLTFGLSITFKRRLGLYGNLFDNTVGMVGFGLVMFWVFAAVFQAFDLIVTHDPVRDVAAGMRNKVPGTPLSSPGDGDYPYYLLGGDSQGRDVFSRMIAGSAIVLQISPFATLFAFMVGIVLGVPSGYLGGKFDTVLSFVANLVLAFPVILLFFLLVTPELIDMGVPTYMAAVLFLFPIIFLVILFQSRFHTRPDIRNIYVGLTLIIGFYLYIGLAWDADPLGLVSMPIGILTVFVSVVFVNSPTVFRIVRGLTLDIRTRDYVAAAQTRGEGAWYIMLWEILPNARGPLLVDFCLRIGYTTILLGTLGFFGLGLPPDSPDWGTSINAGRGLMQFFPFPALVPAVAIMSLVLGLNLLADGLREESLKD